MDPFFQIWMSLSLVKKHEEYYLGGIVKGGEMLKDHFTSLRHGLHFLDRLLGLSTNEDLCHRIRNSVANVKRTLATLTYEQERDTNCSPIMNLDQEFTNMREEMKNVVIKPGTNDYDLLFPEIFTPMSDFITTNDFLLEKIKELMTDDLIGPAMKELKDLRKMLTSLKPLYIYVEDIQCRFDKDKEEKKVVTTLIAVLDWALSLVYLCFIEKIDKEMEFSVKNILSKLIEGTDVKAIYFMTLKVDFSGLLSSYDRDLILLHNLLRVLARNSSSWGHAHYKLHMELSNIKTFIAGLEKNVRLKKLHFFQVSFEAILGQAIPVICLCYAEHLEEYMVRELNGVLLDVVDRIKHIMSETKQIKLYYYPKTDGLGFLEFFLGYLLELLESEQVAAFKNAVDRLYLEMFSLIYLLKVTAQKKLVVEGPLACTIDLAYQAEYVIDLYMVSPDRDATLMSSLSDIIEQVKPIGAEVHALIGKSLHSQDVGSSSQVHGKATQVNNDDVFVGFQEETTIIMEYLLGGEKELDVISIAGMAGAGKTTMALSLYKDSSVAISFDIQAWCTVSQNYQKRDLLLRILGEVTKQEASFNNLDDQELADHLCRSLKKHRYLIILDDIWDATAWNYLRWYLPDDSQRSRVLITTRYLTLGSKIKSKVLELHGLTKLESWKLLLAKLPKKESLSEDLQNIAKDIAVNCKGLPLSIVIIAGILSSVEKTKKRWNEIAQSVTAMVLSDPQGKCIAILELSYNHLPNHLRPCFLYLGAFPEDQQISVTRLISLYVAEGLVRDSESESAEEIAEKYIQDLVVRSLVIPARESLRGVRTCRLHDLLRDFCLGKAKEEHFLSVLDKRNYSRPIQDPRRVSIISQKARRIDACRFTTNDIDFSYHNVRSLIYFNHSDAVNEIDIRIESYDMVLLRVLDICALEVTPTLLSRLVHLRYLAIWRIHHNSSLLSSVTKLRSLQILILKCRELVEVPDSIWDMVKLRHVAILPRASFHVDSKRVHKSSYLLENLRSLSNTCISDVDSKWLSKLLGLRKLSCTLFHSFDNSLKSNCFPVLSHYTQLTTLKLKNGVDYTERVRCRLQLPANLWKLTLSNFFINSDDISEIGRALPLLEVLKLYGFGFLRWSVSDDEFPQLKVLKLKDLKFSNWIVSENSFPCLEQLWLEGCYNLTEMPDVFGYITRLRLISIRMCNDFICDSAREIERVQHDDQNSDFKVICFRNRHDRDMKQMMKNSMKFMVRKFSKQNPELFTIKVHYKGTFFQTQLREYKEGELRIIDQVNEEYFDLMEVDVIALGAGYKFKSFVLYLWRIPLTSLDNGLRPLQCDDDITEFLYHASNFKFMELY